MMAVVNGGEGRDWTADAARAPMGRRGSPHWILLCCSILSIIAMVALATLTEPDERGYGTHEQLGMLPCRAMDWFGVPCPGCGVTTSVALALQGRPLASLANQPFGFLAAFALPAFFLWALLAHLRRRDLYADLSSRRARPVIGAGAAALLAAWVYKIWLVLSG